MAIHITGLDDADRILTDNPFARLLVRLFEEQAASGVTLNLDGLTADPPDA